MADEKKASVTDKWHESYINNSGYIVTGINCPLCGNIAIYNGNYFCIEWGNDWVGGDCTWALSHPAKAKADKAFCDALGLDKG